MSDPDVIPISRAPSYRPWPLPIDPSGIPVTFGSRGKSLFGGWLSVVEECEPDDWDLPQMMGEPEPLL